MRRNRNIPPKSTEEVSAELGGIVREIVFATTSLPKLSTSCTFDLLICTDKNTDIPDGWEVPLCSFSTRIHKVQSIVSYRVS
ncbi:MAD2 mitotic arrest deficient-like 1 [Sparganum proliferum]